MFTKQDSRGGSNMKLGLDRIREEDDFIEVDTFNGTGMASQEAFEQKMQKMMYSMRKDMVDSFTKKLQE